MAFGDGMDEKTVEQITESTQRLVAAAEALQKAMVEISTGQQEISAQQQEISAKVEKIVAAIEDGTVAVASSSEVRPHPNDKKRPDSTVEAGRKTLSPLVTMILAKSGVEDGSDAGLLDKALSTLSPEQRIAVKSEMARAGIIQ